jgi:outer membrane immunogenic protein
MPLKAPPPPVWTWTGIYFGLDAGYGAVTPNDPLTVTNNFGSTTTFPTTLHPTGAFAGAEIGANYQFNFLVVGLEADAQAANISGAYNNVFDTPGGNIASRSMSVNAFGTLRGRIGLALGPALLYGTGGFADTNISNFWQINSVATAQQTTNKTGSVWGGGVEFALGNGNSVKAEYQYFNIGSFAATVPVIPPNGVIITGSPVRNDFQTFRIGINHNFNWIGP